jgi:hypothetical protein
MEGFSSAKECFNVIRMIRTQAAVSTRLVVECPEYDNRWDLVPVLRALSADMNTERFNSG